jgi:hypothetical protein
VNISEIKAELAQLSAVTAAEPKNYAEALQRRQALRRREMLQAELSKKERIANLPEAERARLRGYFSTLLDEVAFERLLKMDESALRQLLGRE